MSPKNGKAALAAVAPETDADNPLTLYQRAVLTWVAAGKRDAVIAEIMGGDSTESSVSNHVIRIMNRLGAGSRAGAVAIAIRKGWIK